MTYNSARQPDAGHQAAVARQRSQRPDGATDLLRVGEWELTTDARERPENGSRAVLAFDYDHDYNPDRSAVDALPSRPNGTPTHHDTYY